MRVLATHDFISLIENFIQGFSLLTNEKDEGLYKPSLITKDKREMLLITKKVLTCSFEILKITLSQIS